MDGLHDSQPHFVRSSRGIASRMPACSVWPLCLAQPAAVFPLILWRVSAPASHSARAVSRWSRIDARISAVLPSGLTALGSAPRARNCSTRRRPSRLAAHRHSAVKPSSSVRRKSAAEHSSSTSRIARSRVDESAQSLMSSVIVLNRIPGRGASGRGSMKAPIGDGPKIADLARSSVSRTGGGLSASLLPNNENMASQGSQWSALPERLLRSRLLSATGGDTALTRRGTLGSQQKGPHARRTSLDRGQTQRRPQLRHLYDFDGGRLADHRVGHHDILPPRPRPPRIVAQADACGRAGRDCRDVARRWRRRGGPQAGELLTPAQLEDLAAARTTFAGRRRSARRARRCLPPPLPARPRLQRGGGRAAAARDGGVAQRDRAARVRAEYAAGASAGGARALCADAAHHRCRRRPPL